MLKKLVSIFIFSCVVSCAGVDSGDKNTNNFVKFLAREEYMKDIEPSRVFNPDSAMLISTLPEKIGNFVSTGKIKDFEIVSNGSGYSKMYQSRELGKGCQAEVFAYHMRHMGISEDIDSEVTKTVYENTKKEILKIYPDSNIISEGVLLFATPSGKMLKMREMVFEYSAPKATVRSYVYFGTSLDSYYRIKIGYDVKLDGYKIREGIQDFVDDFGYYYAEGMSLNDFNEFKRSGRKNSVKIQRIAMQ